MYSFIPLTILFILNILIIYEVQSAGAKQRNLIAAQTGATPGKEVAATERQITTMLLTSTMSFLVLTSPMACLLIIERIWDYSADPYATATWGLLRAISANLMFTNHAINIGLYLVSAAQFRRQFLYIYYCNRQISSAEAISTTMSRV